MLFFIAERLQMSVVTVERMSPREVGGWLEWFAPQDDAPAAPAANTAPADDAIDMRTLSKADLRRMFG